MKEQIVAVLAGRKGSKGLPRKNTRKILGRPALHYPIMAALNSRYVDKIFVSTDDEKIMRESRKFKLEIIKRPAYLCRDDSLMEDALLHAYEEIKIRINAEPKYIVLLMCNAVTVDASLIDKAVEALENDKNADSAVTVSVFNMYSPLRARKKDKTGYLIPFVPFSVFDNPSLLSSNRKSQGDVYFADMGHSVIRPRCLKNIENGLLPQKWMGRKILPIYNSGGCDIDEIWQVDMSARWLISRGFKQSGKK